MADFSKYKVGNVEYDVKDATARERISVLEQKTLPVASTTTLGGVKVGQNLTIDANGFLSAVVDDVSDYVLPAATANELGGIKVGDNLEIDQNGVLSGKNSTTFFVEGTQTAATGNWTGNLPEVDALYEGLTIDYWLPFAGSGNASLTLTLKNGGSTGAIPVYVGGTTRCTTHIAAACITRLVYRIATISDVETPSWWTVRAYDINTTDITNLYDGSSVYHADSVVYRYQLLFQIDEDTLTPLNNVNNSTANTKTMLTDVAFNPFGKIYYYNSTTTVNANGNMSTTLFYHRNGIDARLTFNCASTLTSHKDIYLKVVPQSDGMVKLAADPCWAQDLPSTNDGFWYIFLGRSYSTYQMVLYTEHPVYYHNGTELRKIENIQEASTLSAGLMSAADKSKLDGIEAGANAYELPIASSSELGGVKVGTNLSIDSSTGALQVSSTFANRVSSVESTASSARSTATAAASDARSALTRINNMGDIVNRPDYTISTVDLEDGISALNEGKLYFYYEV